MARTKNRGLQQSFSPSYTVRRWRLGEYIRLSKEDLKKGKDDSNSVINQRDLLNDFYQKHKTDKTDAHLHKQVINQTSRIAVIPGKTGKVFYHNRLTRYKRACLFRQEGMTILCGESA